LAPGFTILFDRGTYHGLRGPERDAYAASVTQLAEPGATLLMGAMAPSAHTSLSRARTNVESVFFS
jgi:hypothetical protein